MQRKDPGTYKTSPTQIEAARRCLRRWYIGWIVGIREPETPAKQFGSDVHSALETFLKTGRWAGQPEVLVRAQVAFRELLAFLNLTAEVSEQDVLNAPRLIEVSVVAQGYPLPVTGKVDLVLPDWGLVVDWKTSSARKWVKDRDALSRDPQVIVYPDALNQVGAIKLPATMLHVYTITRGAPDGLVVPTPIDADTVLAGRSEIALTHHKMLNVLRNQDVIQRVQDVDCNVLACSDFGGCPHKVLCFPSHSPYPPKEAHTMSVNDLFAARKKALAAAEAPTTPPSINPPEAPSVLEAEPPKSFAAMAEKALADGPPVVTGRPKPSKGRKGDLEPSHPTPQATTAATPPPSTETRRVDRTLCIGCLPVTGQTFTLADEWLRPFAARAAESLRVTHWTLADYGKGKAAVVALVAQAIRDGDLPPLLVLDRRSALADAVAELLVPEYTNVFQKMG